MTAYLPQTNYASPTFVESAGAIVFQISTRQICLLYWKSRQKHVLPKGRRNIGESRLQAALREVREETGLSCRALPATILTRSPPAVEEPGVFTPDEPREHRDICEPFMVTVRELGEGKGVKIIWWFMAAVDQEGDGEGEVGFERVWCGLEEAVERLEYEGDREVVRRAVGVFKATFEGGGVV